MHVISALGVVARQGLSVLVHAPAKAPLSAFGWAALLLLIEPLLVTVWDVDTSGTQHIEELQMIQGVFHFSAAGTIFCLALRLRGEVLGVCALRLIVNFVTLAVPGVAFFDDIHLRMEWMELGVSHSVCAGDSPTFHTPSTVVLLRFTGVSWSGLGGQVGTQAAGGAGVGAEPAAVQQRLQRVLLPGHVWRPFLGRSSIQLIT